MSAGWKRRAISAAAPIRRAWAAHLRGQSNQTFKLWTVLTFQTWLAEQRGESVQPPDRLAALAG